MHKGFADTLCFVVQERTTESIENFNVVWHKIKITA
jgi:hypothetical protein